MPAILWFKIAIFAAGFGLLAWTGPLWAALVFGALSALHLVLAARLGVV